MKTHEPTSQFRNENIAIDSPTSGWAEHRALDSYLARCECHAFFFLKFY